VIVEILADGYVFEEMASMRRCFKEHARPPQEILPTSASTANKRPRRHPSRRVVNNEIPCPYSRAKDTSPAHSATSQTSTSCRNPHRRQRQHRLTWEVIYSCRAAVSSQEPSRQVHRYQCTWEADGCRVPARTDSQVLTPPTCIHRCNRPSITVPRHKEMGESSQLSTKTTEYTL
jgi:hypothetical protein